MVTSFAIAAYALAIAGTWALRGRGRAAFTAGLFGICTFVVVMLAPAAPMAALVWCALDGLMLLSWLGMQRAQLTSTLWRRLVGIPGMVFEAGAILAFPWAVAAAIGLPPWGWWLPWALAVVGLLESFWLRREVVDLVLDDRAYDLLQRVGPGASPTSDRPLRIVQITDPHLGTFMPEDRLRRLCERAVALDPDLVLLTGDFLTIESHHAGDALARGLSPLQALPGRVFACRGNHDLESPQEVAGALSTIGARLLVDEAAIVETPAGAVQIVGFDFSWRDRAARLATVCRAWPRQPGVRRIALLHDPGAFHHLPAGEADLVFSGHTHGGQLGLLRLGLPHTAVSAFTSVPDHGLWGRGTDRLYVHRGSGHYGFPVRIGVPAEESLVRVWFA